MRTGCSDGCPRRRARCSTTRRRVCGRCQRRQRRSPGRPSIRGGPSPGGRRRNANGSPSSSRPCGARHADVVHDVIIYGSKARGDGGRRRRRGRRRAPPSRLGPELTFEALSAFLTRTESEWRQIAREDSPLRRGIERDGFSVWYGHEAKRGKREGRIGRPIVNRAPLGAPRVGRSVGKNVATRTSRGDGWFESVTARVALRYGIVGILSRGSSPSRASPRVRRSADAAHVIPCSTRSSRARVVSPGTLVPFTSRRARRRMSLIRAGR